MASIALLLQADRPVVELPSDWLPPPLGRLAAVRAVLQATLGLQADPASADLWLHASADSSLQLRLELGEDPVRIIAITGIFGDSALAIMATLCTALQARVYDCEAGDFIV